MVDELDAIALEPMVVGSGTEMSLGTAAGRRSIEIVGTAETTATAGDLLLRWAQDASNGAATTIEAESYLEVLS